MKQICFVVDGTMSPFKNTVAAYMIMPVSNVFCLSVMNKYLNSGGTYC